MGEGEVGWMGKGREGRVSNFWGNAKALGFETAIHALMHDDNLSAVRSGLNGADVFRRYALMGRAL